MLKRRGGAEVRQLSANLDRGPRVDVQDEGVSEASVPLPHGAARQRAPKRLLALRSDEHLVTRVRDGDEAAFEVLFERHMPGILSFCRHMLGNLEEAEDAVQHSFAAAHGALLRNRREIELKPWLYAIARNRSLSLLRARHEAPDTAAEPSTAGLGQEVRQRADLRALVSDLQDLPDEQRAALVLTELEDLSHAQVAEVLGRPASSVKGLVFRARSGLIERRDARATPCEEIRAELSTARKGTLRKGSLRHHLKECVGCSAYLEEVRRQRRMMALLLPVVPSIGLKRGVLAMCGFGGAGGAGAGGGGLIAASAPWAAGAVAKVAIAGALGAAAIGGGVAIKSIEHHDHSPTRATQGSGTAPAARPGEPARSRTTAPVRPARRSEDASSGRGRSSTHRRSAGKAKHSRGRGAQRRASKPGHQRHGRSGSPPSAGANQRAGAPAPRGLGEVLPTYPPAAPTVKAPQAVAAPRVRRKVKPGK